MNLLGRLDSLPDFGIVRWQDASKSTSDSLGPLCRRWHETDVPSRNVRLRVRT
jgi:hypothetical protein